MNCLFCIQTINVENGHNLPMGGHGHPRYAYVLNKHLSTYETKKIILNVKNQK